MIQMTEAAGLKTLNNFYSEEVLFAPFLEKSIKCDAVLCSWDVELTYAKIRTAMELIARGAEFYATNQDTTFPNFGQKWPGTGVIVAAIQTCVRKPPKIVFGKPNVYGIEIIFKYLNNLKSGPKYRYKDALVVGDRLETDIWQANNAGIDSIFVETGINKRSDIPQDPKTKEQKKLVPTFTLSHIKEMFQFSSNS
jgi:HAD superfamily hydrolase (TIGR01450 family)